MKKYIFCFLFVVLGFVQKPAKSQEKISVEYSYFVNGKESEGRGKTQLLIDKSICEIKQLTKRSENSIPSPVESRYLDFVSKRYIQSARLNNKEIVSTIEDFADLPVLELTGETETILGYECQKARTVVFSNQIEVWFSTNFKVSGTPWPTVGIPGGLVLKIVRNGNYEMLAQKVDFPKSKDLKVELPNFLGETVSKSVYGAKIRNSHITIVDVFKNEQICWGYEQANPEDRNGYETFHFAGGTLIARKVKLPELSDDYMLFAEVTQYSNGDAYDRTGSIFLIPTDKDKSFLDGLWHGKDSLPGYFDAQGKKYEGVVSTENYSPLIELVRFFTPFGISHYNDKRQVPGIEWEDSAQYKQDITNLLPILQGEVWIGAFIGNYDKGGHKLSLKLKYFPTSREIKENTKKYWISPVFNTLNVLEMAGQTYGTMFNNDSLKVQFEVPRGLKSVQLQYISTGHGGWGGGDEFNQKINEIFIDNKLAYSYIPWRNDCSCYRQYNPSSGNFWNGLSSSDYSRSGWCPGTITNPHTILLNDLKPGRHEMKVAISLGKSEGTSFSAWNISGVLIGEFE